MRTVTWGGKPFKPPSDDDDPSELSPRRSFAQWHQVVEGTSDPWTATDIATARMIGASVTDVISQFRAVQIVIAKDQLDQVSSRHEGVRAIGDRRRFRRAGCSRAIPRFAAARRAAGRFARARRSRRAFSPSRTISAPQLEALSDATQPGAAMSRCARATRAACRCTCAPTRSPRRRAGARLCPDVHRPDRAPRRRDRAAALPGKPRRQPAAPCRAARRPAPT